MNGYHRTEPRRRFPSQNRHPIDVFSGYDDNEFNHHQQPQQNNFAPIRESNNLSQQQQNGIGGGGFYQQQQEYRSGRSSVPAHLLNSSSTKNINNNSDTLIFNLTHPSPVTSATQQQKGKVPPFIDSNSSGSGSDFDYHWNPKQILDSFQKQSSDSWLNQASAATRGGGGNSSWNQKSDPPQNQTQKFDNWLTSTKSNQQDQSTITKVPWRQNPNNFQSISDNHNSSLVTNRLIDDLLAPYSLETSPLANQQQEHNNHHHLNSNQYPNQQQQRSSINSINFRNPQPYYPYRRPSSALADPFVHSSNNNSNFNNSNSTPNSNIQGGGGNSKNTFINPLRQQNRERIQPLHIRSPFAAAAANNNINGNGSSGSDSSDQHHHQQQPRPTHRTFSEPNSEPPHTLDILSTSLYDPNSPYYSNNRQSHPQAQTQQNQPNNNNQRQSSDFSLLNNNNFQKSHFSDSDDLLFDDDMSRTTANWKNSFAAMRDRFGTKEKTPDESSSINNDLPFGFDYSFASNGSLTMPRSRGLLKSASQSIIGNRGIEPSRSSSLLREALVNRRASEAPDFSSQNGRRSSDTPEPTAKKPIGNFWIDTVKNRPTSPSISRLPFKMTTAAERLEQLHEPLDSNSSSSNGPPLPLENRNNQDYYVSSSTTTINNNGNNIYGGGGGTTTNSIYRKNAPDSVVSQRRNQFIVDPYSSSSLTKTNNNGFHDNSTPFPSERFVSERKTNGHQPNFSSLDNAVADLKQNAEKLFNDSRGCARFPIGEFNASPTKRLGIFTGTRISPPRYISTNNHQQQQQHSPSPDSLSGESTNSLAHLPHPRPKHNIREQLANAGVTTTNTYLGPYLGRRSVTPNFPTPTSGSVASRISVFEKRPGTPTLLQLASAASTSADNAPEPPRSPLSPRTTVFRTKPVIHMDINEAATTPSTHRGGAISPEYDNKRITTVSTSAAFHFPQKVRSPSIIFLVLDLQKIN